MRVLHTKQPHVEPMAKKFILAYRKDRCVGVKIAADDIHFIILLYAFGQISNIAYVILMLFRIFYQI